MDGIELKQKKLWLWMETSYIIVYFFISIFVLSIDFDILLYLAFTLLVLVLFYPSYFRHPKKISLFGDHVVIETKLKKYIIALNDIKKVKTAYTRATYAYRIKVKGYFISFFLNDRFYGVKELNDFIKILKTKVNELE